MYLSLGKKTYLILERFSTKKIVKQRRGELSHFDCWCIVDLVHVRQNCKGGQLPKRRTRECKGYFKVCIFNIFIFFVCLFYTHSNVPVVGGGGVTVAGHRSYYYNCFFFFFFFFNSKITGLP